MAWFKGSKSALTAQAERLSGLLISLSPQDRETASNTIRAITTGVRTMGQLPEPIIECLWGLLVTIARKALMPGASSEKIVAELEAGIDPEVKSLIWENSK